MSLCAAASSGVGEGPETCLQWHLSGFGVNWCLRGNTVLTISVQKHRSWIASHRASTIPKRKAETCLDIHEHCQSKQELSATQNLVWLLRVFASRPPTLLLKEIIYMKGCSQYSKANPISAQQMWYLLSVGRPSASWFIKVNSSVIITVAKGQDNTKQKIKQSSAENQKLNTQVCWDECSEVHNMCPVS